MKKILKWDPKYFNKVFALVILVKIILMGCCSSDYEGLMFMPFVKSFLDGHNPYEYYYANNLLASFPYPPLMLLIESIFGWCAVKLQNLFISRVLFKIPLLVFDIIGYCYLKKICEGRRKYTLILYFTSPIILFSTYMHGQLDIVPTVLLVISLYYLTRGNKNIDYHISAIILGCSLATKLHILAVVPILLIYIYKRAGINRCVVYIGETGGVLISFIAPFFGTGFINTVLVNKEQSLIAKVLLDYGSVQLLLVIVVIMVLYLKIYQVSNMNKELLLSVVGVLFSVFLGFVAPMPGWFVWIVPFVYLYFVEVNDNKYVMLSIYAAFNFIYLVYFIFCHHTGFVSLYIFNTSFEFLKINQNGLCNIVFTVLVSILLVIVWGMYQYGMAQNGLYRRNNTPFTIGIAGDSGTGKSELLEKLEDTLGRNKILHIEGDGDHRWERGSRNWEQYTHLDPRANFLYKQAEDISILRAGNMVHRVDYDHNTGKFTEKRKIRPKPFIILCGLHPLFLPKSREALDLKIYMDTDEILRRYWKIQRDTQERGYTSDKTIEQINKRIPDAEKYIYPQKEYADLIIKYFDANLKDCFVKDHKEVISLMLTMDVSVNMENVIESLRAYGINVTREFNANITKQIITISGDTLDNKMLNFSQLACEVLGDYAELFENNITWHSGVDGILQIILLAMISNIMRGF